MYTWIKAFKEGHLSTNEAVHTPNNALTLNEELIELSENERFSLEISTFGRCYDNARCESMQARFKEELLYGRYDTTTMTAEQLAA